MSSKTTIDFSKLNVITANGTKITDLWYKKRNPNTGAETSATLLWTSPTTKTITVTLTFMTTLNGGGQKDEVTESWDIPANYTWQDVIDKDLISSKTSGGYSCSLFVIPADADYPEQESLDDVVGFQVGGNQYWLACEGYYDMVPVNTALIDGATYFLVKRTKADEQTKYSKLELGDNEIVIKADEPNFYFFAKEAGTYVFSASSDNAFLGYEEQLKTDDGEEYFEANWVEGTSFELTAKEGEVLYICCSNQDFSNETYTLTITKQ